jgi:hypothetical protein
MTQVFGTLAAVYGWIVHPIGWGYAMLVWGCALVWFVIENIGKILTYRASRGHSIWDSGRFGLAHHSLQGAGWPSKAWRRLGQSNGR